MIKSVSESCSRRREEADSRRIRESQKSASLPRRLPFGLRLKGISRHLATLRFCGLFCIALELTGQGPLLQAAPGALDVSFNPGAGVDFSVYALAPQIDGRVLIAGNFTTV